MFTVGDDNHDSTSIYIVTFLLYLLSIHCLFGFSYINPYLPPYLFHSRIEIWMTSFPIHYTGLVAWHQCDMHKANTFVGIFQVHTNLEINFLSKDAGSMHFIYALQARPLSVGDFPSYFNHLLRGETTLLCQLPSSAEKPIPALRKLHCQTTAV